MAGFQNEVEDQLSLYMSNYDALRSWSLNSMDIIKNELLIGLCFPVFVHCDKMLKTRVVVRLSGLAYSLLTRFLLQNDVHVITSVINNRIHLKKELDSTLVGNDISSFLKNEFDGVAVDRFPTCKVELGVPGFVGSKLAVTNPDTREDVIYREWLSRLVRPESLLKSVNKRHLSGKDSLNWDHNNGQNGAQHGGFGSHSTDNSIGSPENPSILFATMTNVLDNMICMRYNSDASQVACGFHDNAVRVWRMNDNNSSALASTDNIADSLSVLPKSRYHQDATAGTGGINGAAGSKFTTFRGHSMPVYGIDQNSTGRLVLSSSGDESIRLWDVKLGQCVGKYTTVSPAWDVSFSPFGYYFAAANQDKTVTVHATDRLTPLRMMTGHLSDTNCVVWHGNGVYVATGSDDKTVRLWDIRSNVDSGVRVLTGSTAPISTVSISSNGRLIAAGNDLGVILLWDLDAGKQLATLQGHTSVVNSLSFSGDGSTLVSGSADCSVRLWQLNTVIDGLKLSPHGERSHAVICPKHTYFTKFSPVHCVKFIASNVVCAGGPFSIKAATSHRETAGRSNETGIKRGASVVEHETEQETITSLGMSHAVYVHPN